MMEDEKKERIFQAEPVAGEDAFDEDLAQRVINGAPVYYGTTQVAEMMGEPESNVRYWSEEFDFFLRIKRNGRKRQYTQRDIANLQFIVRTMREKGWSMQQAKEFLSTEGFVLEEPIKESRDRPILDAVREIVASEYQEQMRVWETDFFARLDKHLLENIHSHFENFKALLPASASPDHVLDAAKDDLIAQLRQELAAKDETEVVLRDEFEQIKAQLLASAQHQTEILREMQTIRERDERFLAHVNEFRAKAEQPKGFFARLFRR